MPKWIRRLVGAIAAALCAVLVIGIAVGNYFYNLALNPRADRSMVFEADHNAVGRGVDGGTSAAARGDSAAWLANAVPEDLYMTSGDGLRLHALEVAPAQDHHLWTIVYHGYSGNAQSMAQGARRFYDMGFGVLMPDARGHGLSEGDYIGMGWPDRRDVVQWIDLILQRDPQAQIILYGISMGGATVMMTAGEALPENVRAIVEDCGYSSVWDEFAYQMHALFGLPAFPVLNFASLVTRVRAGYGFAGASATAQVAKSQTPILFIHGDSDTFVPGWMVYEVYEAAPQPKELLIAPGAGHGAASAVLGEAYWETVEAFVRQYLD